MAYPAAPSFPATPDAASGGGGGGGGGTGSWATLVDIDCTDVTTASAQTSGTVTLQFESSDATLSQTVTRFSSANGSVTATNGTGLLCDGGTGSGTVTAAWDIDALLDSYTRADVSSYIYAVHVVITSLVYPNAGSSQAFIGVNKGNNASHNGGEARGIYLKDNNDGTNEDVRVRSNTSNSSVLATTAIKTSRVITSIVLSGAIVEIMDTSGTTPPTPLPGGSGTITVGGDAVGLNDLTPIYQGDGLNAYVGVGEKADCTVTRILVQRYK